GVALAPVYGSGRWPACTARVLNPKSRGASSIESAYPRATDVLSDGRILANIRSAYYLPARRHPPIVLTYEVRGREEAVAAVTELAAALARGSGGPVLRGCERVL